MTTYSQQPDGPGAMLWAVVIMTVLLGTLLFMLYGCEITFPPPPEPIQYSNGDSVVLAVRPIKNDYACAPCAVGMLIQYWDDMRWSVMNDYSDIVNDQHMEYYAYPKDNEESLLPDSSIIKNPPKNCLADFMRTSWYSRGNYYKATHIADTWSGLNDYMKWKGDNYYVDASEVCEWDDVMSSVDKGIPIVLTVEIYRPPAPAFWHSLLLIGYVKSEGAYLVYDDFGTLRKHKWNWVADQNFIDEWLVMGAFKFEIDYKNHEGL